MAGAVGWEVVFSDRMDTAHTHMHGQTDRRTSDMHTHNHAHKHKDTMEIVVMCNQAVLGRQDPAIR